MPRSKTINWVIPLVFLLAIAGVAIFTNHSGGVVAGSIGHDLGDYRIPLLQEYESIPPPTVTGEVGYTHGIECILGSNGMKCTKNGEEILYQCGYTFSQSAVNSDSHFPFKCDNESNHCPTALLTAQAASTSFCSGQSRCMAFESKGTIQIPICLSKKVEDGIGSSTTCSVTLYGKCIEAIEI